LITEVQEAVQQASLLSTGKVMTKGNKVISIHIDTLCIHGDGPRAIEFARAIHEFFKMGNNPG
jgi:UPF0271 protein